MAKLEVKTLEQVAREARAADDAALDRVVENKPQARPLRVGDIVELGRGHGGVGIIVEIREGHALVRSLEKDLDAAYCSLDYCDLIPVYLNDLSPQLADDGDFPMRLFKRLQERHSREDFTDEERRLDEDEQVSRPELVKAFQKFESFYERVTPTNALSQAFGNFKTEVFRFVANGR